VDYNLYLTLPEAVFGAEKVVAFNRPEGVNKVSVKVPPGIASGKKLRLAGKGEPGVSGGPSGDLLVNIVVGVHERFKREGDDLVLDLAVRTTEAMLGTEARVETLEGKTLSLRIPPGTQNQTRMRIPGFGVPRLKGVGRGDLMIRIVIETPTVLTEKQKELLKALAEEGL
jgi:curved DNA-binding protein